MTIKTAYNRRLAKVAVQCSADSFVVNLSLILRINICGENRHLSQAPNRCANAKTKYSIKIHGTNLKTSIFNEKAT